MLPVKPNQVKTTSEAITRGVRIQVAAEYDPSRSLPEQSRWFFLYTVTIVNEGETTVKLVSRHWIIAAGDGDVQEVRGAGVVGEQPILAPGESFEYTSGCPLEVPMGTMRGSYRMETPRGEAFQAQIAPFDLSGPFHIN